MDKNQGMAGWVPSEGSRTCFLAFSSFGELPTFLGSWPPFILKDKQLQHSNPASFVTPPSLTLTVLPSFVFKDPHDYIWPMCVIQDTVPTPSLQLISTLVPSATLIPPFHVIYHIHRFQGLGLGHL